MQQFTTLNSSKHTLIPQPQQDSLDLSNVNYRQELEALLYKKVTRGEDGEDVAACVEALKYFATTTRQDTLLDKVYADAKKELSVFNSVQRVVITAFAILGMIGVFNGAFTQARHNPASVTPSALPN